MGIFVEVVDVNQMLGSVRRICDAGLRVAFDADGNYVGHKGAGESVALSEERGPYILTLWEPLDKREWAFYVSGQGRCV